MNFTPLLKKCGLCSFETCLIYKNKNNISCPLCMNDTININGFITNEIHSNKNYHYCQACNVLFNYDETVIHHVLDNFGKIYYANLIKRCKIENHEVNFMPKFHSLELCIEMLNKNVIEIEWINFLKNDTCCVCFEETYTFTECNHALCKTCRDCISNPFCPICRHNQQYKKEHYVYDNDDENDDYDVEDDDYNNEDDDYNNEDDDYNNEDDDYNNEDDDYDIEDDDYDTPDDNYDTQNEDDYNNQTN